MADGEFVRLNAQLLQNSPELAEGKLISVVGRMEAFDGEVLTFRASDGNELKYRISDTDFKFVQGTVVELMGARSDDGTLDGFVSRAIGDDFDLDLYNDFLTKVYHSQGGRFHGYFGQS